MMVLKHAVKLQDLIQLNSQSRGDFSFSPEASVTVTQGSLKWTIVATKPTQE